jgi:alpha-beta hydrolase superfamily lysophospholipase
MEEDIASLVDLVHPGESERISDLDQLSLTWRYVVVPEPNPKKLRIFVRRMVRVNAEPKASLCIVHGFAEHSGKLIHIAVRFALEGFEVHMVDLRSYGLSGGARAGHSLEEFQQDILLLLQQVRDDLPCFLYGHSMGGLLTSIVCMNNPELRISGAVISAPLFGTSTGDISPFKEKLVSGMADALNEFVLNSYIQPSCLSKDDVFLKNMYNDNKLMPLFGPALGASIKRHMNYALATHIKLHIRSCFSMAMQIR